MNTYEGLQDPSQPVFQVSNAKTIKGESLGYLTLIRYLAPSDVSGVDVCPKAGACKSTCLYTAGRGRFGSVQEARVKKTLAARLDRRTHLAQAFAEVEQAMVLAKSRGFKLAVRMNGTSDLPADARLLKMAFPKGVRVYDYTKIERAAWANDGVHRTLSYDPETVNETTCRKALAAGVNIAVVFAVKRNDALPSHHFGARVIDGDLHDLRFLDPRGVVVGLRAKGEAKADTSGFVVRSFGGCL